MVGRKTRSGLGERADRPTCAGGTFIPPIELHVDEGRIGNLHDAEGQFYQRIFAAHAGGGSRVRPLAHAGRSAPPTEAPTGPTIRNRSGAANMARVAVSQVRAESGSSRPRSPCRFDEANWVGVVRDIVESWWNLRS